MASLIHSHARFGILTTWNLLRISVFYGCIWKDGFGSVRPQPRSSMQACRLIGNPVFGLNGVVHMLKIALAAQGVIVAAAFWTSAALAQGVPGQQSAPHLAQTRDGNVVQGATPLRGERPRDFNDAQAGGNGLRSGALQVAGPLQRARPQVGAPVVGAAPLQGSGPQSGGPLQGAGPLQGGGPLQASGPLQGAGPLLGAGPLQGAGPLLGAGPLQGAAPLISGGALGGAPPLTTIPVAPNADPSPIFLASLPANQVAPTTPDLTPPVFVPPTDGPPPAPPQPPTTDNTPVCTVDCGGGPPTPPTIPPAQPPQCSGSSCT